MVEANALIEKLPPPHQVLRFDTAEDITSGEQQLPQDILPLRTIGFDLDGTLIGSTIPFPLNGLLELRDSDIGTVVVSGAGPSSIAKKIERGLGKRPTTLSEVFSAPFASNEGAYTISHEASLYDLQATDIIDDISIGGDDLEHLATFAQEHAEKVDFYGFYPSKEFALQNQRDPFSYIFHARDDKEQHALKEKYDAVTLTDSLPDFLSILRKAGVSKFVIKAEPSVIQELLTNVYTLPVRAVTNEGYLNIVAPGTDKLGALRRIAATIQNVPEVSADTLSFFGNDWNDMEALTGVPLGFVVDSNPEATDQIIVKISEQKKQGNTVIVAPDLLDNTLRMIAQIKSNG